MVSQTPSYSWSDAGDLGIAAVTRQLEVYEESLKDIEKQKKTSADTSLFDAVVTKIEVSISSGTNPREDIKAIGSLPPSVLAS